MNTGLQNGFNLGWKLTLVGHGQEHDGLLGTLQEAERQTGVTDLVVASGAKARKRPKPDRPDQRELTTTPRSATSSQILTLPTTKAAADSEIDRQYPSREPSPATTPPVSRPGVLLPSPERIEADQQQATVSAQASPST